MVVNKHISYGRKILFFFALLTFYACSSGENGLLELALDKSGENTELEVVLDHYKDDLKKLESLFILETLIYMMYKIIGR